MGDVWIFGGVCYGFATDKARTGPILDAVLDRVLSQPVGPRFVAGDWNLELQDLPQLSLLRARGFIEVQDLKAARTGQVVEPTCKGKTRKLLVYITRIAVDIFGCARVDPKYWADHSIVSASFALPVLEATRRQGGSGDCCSPRRLCPLLWRRVRKVSTGLPGL